MHTSPPSCETTSSRFEGNVPGPNPFRSSPKFRCFVEKIHPLDRQTSITYACEGVRQNGCYFAVDSFPSKAVRVATYSEYTSTCGESPPSLDSGFKHIDHRPPSERSLSFDRPLAARHSGYKYLDDVLVAITYYSSSSPPQGIYLCL